MKTGIFLLITGFTFSLFACETLDPSLFKKKPKASIEKFDIKSISLRDIDLLFDIGIKNPFPIGLNLAGVKFKFLIEKNQVFETKTSKGLKIGANSKKITQFIVNLKYRDIEKAVRSYLRKDYLNCEVLGEIIVKLPKIGIPGVPSKWSFPFKLKKKIPAIKPVVKVKNFKVKMPSIAEIKEALKKARKEALQPDKVADMFKNLFSGKAKKAAKIISPDDLDLKLTVNFDIMLENKTRAKIRFKTLEYDFFINAQKLVAGKTKDIRAAGNKSILRISNQFSSKSLSKSILKAFRNRNADFIFKGHTFIQLPRSIKKEPVKLKFDEKGNFKF